VKVTTPAALETPEAAEIVSVPTARLEASVTVLPATADPPPSFKVTVMVEGVEPLATTVPGEASTVD
jgi:hypothetical protein